VLKNAHSACPEPRPCVGLPVRWNCPVGVENAPAGFCDSTVGSPRGQRRKLGRDRAAATGRDIAASWHAVREANRVSQRSARSHLPSDALYRRGQKKIAHNPMNQDVEIRLANLRRALRCGARTRAGSPCECPAIRGRSRCRLHGGRSPGAPRGSKNGNFKTGNWTADAIEERGWLRSLVQSFANNGSAE
jgi:hypothetical protein